MNTLSTINRCTQYTLLVGAAGWVLSCYLHPLPLPASLGHLEFLLILFAVGVVPTVTVIMPTLHPGKEARTTSLWFGIISATLLMSIATVAHLALAAASAAACLLSLGCFYLLKRHFLLAARADSTK